MVYNKGRGEKVGERSMSLFFTQLLSFHTPEETYLYCVSVFSIPENPHFPELPD